MRSIRRSDIRDAAKSTPRCRVSGSPEIDPHTAAQRGRDVHARPARTGERFPEPIALGRVGRLSTLWRTISPHSPEIANYICLDISHLQPPATTAPPSACYSLGRAGTL